MSKSVAKKMRLKQQREGRRNPELDRLSWHNVNPIAKKTPTITERRSRIENKHKKRNQSHIGDDSFYIYFKNLFKSGIALS